MGISPSAFPSSAEAYEHRVDVWPRVLPLASISAALLQFVSILPLEAKRGQTRSPSDVFGVFLLHVCPPLAKCMEKSSLLLSGNSISSQGWDRQRVWRSNTAHQQGHFSSTLNCLCLDSLPWTKGVRTPVWFTHCRDKKHWTKPLNLWIQLFSVPLPLV